MKHLRKLAACALIPLVVAGCASTDGSGDDMNNWCVIGGAVAGAAGGGLASSEVGGAAIGALAGAVLGPVLCANGAPSVDSDGDGVPDNADDCPGTPPGAPVDARGCPLDSDGDGVPDYRDECPNTPAGTVVDKFNGCPLDSDGDGVADANDRCPSTPKGQRVGADGCPVCNEELAVVPNVNFAFDSAKINKDAQSKLTGVTELLNSNSAIDVVIEGHTDSVGSNAYNQRLSERRAQAVASHLSSQGVAAGRMTTVGKGETMPLVSNNSAAGRAVNRRVEFKAACPK